MMFWYIQGKEIFLVPNKLIDNEWLLRVFREKYILGYLSKKNIYSYCPMFIDKLARLKMPCKTWVSINEWKMWNVLFCNSGCGTSIPVAIGIRKFTSFL